uniref:Polyprotein n=1 Tax=Haemonchus placei TaxID=6290 RepID=A0A0N4X3A0_HAEPC
LTTLLTRTNVSSRILRWALEARKYNVKIIYFKGAANRVADALSPGPVDENSLTLSADNIVAAVAEEPNWFKELRNNVIYKNVIEILEQSRMAEDVVFPNRVRKFMVADFSMHDEYLNFIDNGDFRKVIPQAHRKSVFLNAHAPLLAEPFFREKC